MLDFRYLCNVQVVVSLLLGSAVGSNTTQPAVEDGVPNSLSDVKSLEDLYNLIQSQGSWALPVTFGSMALLLICCCTCCIYRCATRKVRKSKQAAGSAFERGAGSIRTMARRIDATPSKALQRLGGKKAKHDSDSVALDIESDDDGDVRPARPISKRIPESYGRIDKETQDRIQSIRMSARFIKPIVPQAEGPNAKALRMMGITEQEAEQKYAPEAKSARMKKLALGAGGGLYSTGLGTAKFGNQIGEGFAALRARNAERARKRKEEAEAKAAAALEKAENAEDFRNIKLKPSNTPRSGNKPKPAAPKEPKAATSPSKAVAAAGGNKLAAFLGKKEDSYSKLSDGEEEEEVVKSDRKLISVSKSSSSINVSNSKLPVSDDTHTEVVPGIAPGPKKLAAFLSTVSAPSVPEPESDADESDSGDSAIDEVL